MGRDTCRCHHCGDAAGKKQVRAGVAQRHHQLAGLHGVPYLRFRRLLAGYVPRTYRDFRYGPRMLLADHQPQFLVLVPAACAQQFVGHYPAHAVFARCPVGQCDCIV